MIYLSQIIPEKWSIILNYFQCAERDTHALETMADTMGMGDVIEILGLADYCLMRAKKKMLEKAREEKK